MLVAAVSKAATVASANDYPSTLETSSLANHSLVFTTPSGVSEGETMIISFASPFDVSSITEDDVDVEDDGLDLTTAPDCAGADQTSVVIVGNALTVTICPGDAGSIAASSVVTIDIGTNATSYGTGTNQIVNPSVTGTYYIGIAGSFGDSGSIALPMLEEGSLAVSAEVTENGDGGGTGSGGPTGCGDSVAPEISSVIVSGVTASSATITWNTSESATSIVDFGITGSYESGTESDTSLILSHSIVVDGLSGGMMYHFRVRSADICGNQAASFDQTFTTTDTVAPVISGVRVSLSCDTDAVIAWSTDESANSLVEYGSSSAYGSRSSDPNYGPMHAMRLSGLGRDLMYHYRVSSADVSGNLAKTDDATFTTNLDSAPLNVSGFSVTPGDGMVSLAWTNSTVDFSGVRVLMCDDTYPTNESDASCSSVYLGSGSSVSVSSLTNGVTYYFGAFSYDACGQFASGALGSGTPSASEEEPLPPEEEVPPVETPPEEIPTSGEGGETLPEEVPAGEETPAESQGEEAEAPVVIPPTTVAAGEEVPQRDIQFFVANRQIQLSTSSSGEVHMLSSRPLSVELLTEHIIKPVDRVQLVLGESAYLMALTQDATAYATDVSSPGSFGSHALAVSIRYLDGTTQSLSLVSSVEPDGYGFAVEDNQTHRVGDANAMLLINGTAPWDGSPFGQFNPFSTGSDGTFGWYVPNTTYALSVSAAGYAAATTGTFSVTDNIANPTVQLEPMPIAIVPEVVSPTSSQTETGTEIEAKTGVASIVASATGAAANAIEKIRNIQGVEQTAAVSIPALAVTTTAATVVLAASFDLIPFLQYAFTSPLLFFWRRRRKAFGVAYNAITKMPLDLATVRLYRMPDDWDGQPDVSGRLFQSRVTDKGGRYFFLPPSGRYRIVASKNGFDFPSQYLAGRKDDGAFLDVYHGGMIEVTGAGAVIAANLPLEPSGSPQYHEPRSILFMRKLRVAQQGVAVAGIVLSLVAAVIRPSIVSVSLVGVQIAFYLLVRRLAVPRKPKSWGIVYDKSTGRPLERAIARVFEPTYNKLLETAVTDSRGRYAFILGPNEYYTVYEKQGFEPSEVHPIDYRANAEPKEFSADVPLAPKAGVPSSQGSSEMTPLVPTQPPTASV